MRLRGSKDRQIIRLDNGRPMRSHIAFDYIDPDLPTLKILREQEGLDRLADDAASELDLIVNVIHYVKQQWDHSWHPPMQHVNALEVLEDVRCGLRGNFCVYFTHVLVQALWSLGIPCRYTYVGEHHWSSHATSECWSNDYRKWMTVDGDFNLHYVRAEYVGEGRGPVRAFVPQNARDVQRAWRNGQIAHILPVQGEGGTGFDPADRLGKYYGGGFAFLADYQRVLEGGPPEWEGQRCHWYLWQEQGAPLADYHLHHFNLTFGNCVCKTVSDPEQYYWPLNEVVIDPASIECAHGDTLQLSFETFTPFFASLLVRVDEGSWEKLKAERVEGHRAFGTYYGKLGPGRNVIEIRSQNRCGRLGPIAALEIASPPYVPPQAVRLWSGGESSAGLGAFAAHDGRLYVPQKFAGKVAVVRRDQIERKIGTRISLPPYDDKPPAEPWSEAVNLRRAAEAAQGCLLDPQACAVAPDGTLYVADAENYRVQPFAADGQPLVPWGTHGADDEGFLHIRALAVGADGSVYVADSGYAGNVGVRTEHVSRLRRFDPQGTCLRMVARSGTAPGEVCSPAGLAIDAAGNIWVADSANHRVQCFNPEGETLACWGECGDGWGRLRYPTAVAVAPDRCVFVADPQHRCVWKFSNQGEPLARIDRALDGAPLVRPGRLAVTDVCLFVGDVGNGEIYEFSL